MLNPEDSATQGTAENERQANPCVFSHKFMYLSKGAVTLFTFWGKCGHFQQFHMENTMVSNF